MKTVPELASRLKEIREEKRECNERHAELSKEEKEVVEELVIALSTLGLESASVAGVGRATVTPKNFPRIVDPKKFYAYLSMSGQTGLIKETVNENTLRGWFNDSGMSVNQARDIGLEVFVDQTISLRKE